MPETHVFDDGHALPYSKGLMAQTLSASGLSPERAYELARMVERRLDSRGETGIETPELYTVVEAVLADEEGDGAVRRFRQWRLLGGLDRPLIVLLSGTTGVGKSTLATMLASRLGITRVIATDVIRQVLRAFFSGDVMPIVQYSAFEAGRALEEVPAGADPDIVGFARQADAVEKGVEAILERACMERTPMVVEGVHLVPGSLSNGLRKRCIAVEAVLNVEDEELHRAHFSMRGGQRPPERYLRGFERIRKLQEYLVERGNEAGVAVIENESIDEALRRMMALVLESVGRVSSSGAS